MKSTSHPKIPKWLKRLQENSWEMEILISGGAIFSLFQLSDFYIDWIQQIRISNHLPGAGILLILGMFGLKILTLGFTLHLVSRGFWLSLVCLNDVYPEGLKASKIKWKKPFRTDREETKNLKDQIISVDKFCGSIMYLSIVSAFAIIGLVVLVIFISATIYFVDDYHFQGVSISGILISLFLVYIVDLLSFGSLRSVPFLSYLVFPLFRLFDALSLRRFYQHSLWTFNTNISKPKFSFLAFLFLLGALVFTFNSLYQVMHWPNVLDDREYRYQLAEEESIADLHYMDYWSAKKSYYYGIQSKVIRGNFMEVYFHYPKSLDAIIALSHEDEKERYFENIVQVEIDLQPIYEVSWHPTKKYDQKIGISAMIDVSKYENGRHNFTFTFQDSLQEAYRDLTNSPLSITIPFWIDRIGVNVDQKASPKIDIKEK
ncbi:MAG: hypothetical protein RIC95_06600 [Vicingaceae bacterium]